MTTKFLRVLTALIVLFTCACGGGTTSPSGSTGNSGGGSSSGGSGGSTSSKVLTATVNGASWSATTMTGVFLQNSFTVAGNDGQGKNITISANISGPGTFSLATGNANSALGQWIDSNSGQFSSGIGGSGTLVVTAAGLTRLTGTFEFVARTSAAGNSSVTLTNGRFDITTP